MKTQTIKHLAQKADWFIPPSVRNGDEDTLRQARTVIWFTFFFVPFNPMAVLFYAWSGLDILILPVTLSGLAVALCPFLIRWTGSSRLACNVALISYVVSVTLVTALTGGTDSPILWWLAPLPFIAGNILGNRGCVFWCTASVLVAVFFFAFLPQGIIGPHSLHAQNAHPAMLVSTFFAILGTMVAAFIYIERYRIASLVRMKEANGVLRIGRDKALNAFEVVAQEKQRAETALAVAETARLNLEEVNRIKSEILRMAAHDLRGPLGEVSALGTFIAENDDLALEDIRNYVSLMAQTTDRLQIQLGGVLEMNQLETGQIQPDFSQVSLNELVQGVLESFEARAHQKKMQLTFESNCSEFHIETDVLLAARVLENLLSNAIKYSPLGSPVSISIEKRDCDAVVAVTDTGPGLSPTDQEKLYRPFSKLTPVPTDGEPSTGVGLSIVKNLVEVLGGNIGCESELGHGTTFRVSFPSASDCIPLLPAVLHKTMGAQAGPSAKGA